MSAFVIEEAPNKHYSTLLKTRIWIVSSKLLNIETYLQAVSQKHQSQFTVIHSVHIVGYSLPGSGNSPP